MPLAFECCKKGQGAEASKEVHCVGSRALLRQTRVCIAFHRTRCTVRRRCRSPQVRETVEKAKCKTVNPNLAPEFCGDGKVFDTTKRMSECAGVSCDAASAADVTTCCKADPKAVKANQATVEGNQKDSAAKAPAKDDKGVCGATLRVMFDWSIVVARCLYALEGYSALSGAVRGRQHA